MKRAFPILALTAVVALATPVHTYAAAKLIKIDGHWQAFTDVDGKGKKACFAGSSPIKSEGKYAKRGHPFLVVTHWPADKVFGEVRFDAGYPLKKGQPVTVTVGSGTVKLTRIDGESAWADTTKEDAAVVAAIRAGKTLIVRAESSRGTKTVDTFSLDGSSAALTAIDTACHR